MVCPTGEGRPCLGRDGSCYNCTAVMIEVVEKPRRGFGRYRLLLRMARGGMANLYLARLSGPVQFEKLLAVKRIHAHLARHERFNKMFIDEARIAARIQHPNVATVFEMGRHAGSYFIAMEYVHGEDLHDLIKSAQRGREEFTWRHAAHIVAEAAAGLHAAHELKDPDGTLMGVVHRDVSPRNIIVSYDGHAKLVDFGVAYALRRLSETTVGTVKGKVGYMSPEQISGGSVDRRSDVFSMGAVLFEAVCRKRLFEGKNHAEIVRKITQAEIPRPRSIRDDIPPALEQVILRALAKHRDARFETAADMEEAMEGVLRAPGHPVGHRQFAQFMERTFGDRKKAKDLHIQAVLTEDDITEPAGVSSAETTRVSGSQQGHKKGAHREAGYGWTGRKGWMAAAGGVGLVLAGTVLTVLLLSGPRSESPARKEGRTIRTAGAAAGSRDAGRQAVRGNVKTARKVTQAVGQAERPPKGKVLVTVQVLPEKASAVVVFRGVSHYGSLFRMVVAKSDKTEKLAIRAAGHEPVEIDVKPSRDLDKIVILRKLLPRPPPWGRTRKPARPRREPPAADLVKKLPR